MKSGGLVISLVALACFGCDRGPSISLHTPEVAATAQLKKFAHPKWGDIVFGRLIITGTDRTLVSADINCFYLRIGDHKSGELSVDSYVDYARVDWPASDGMVSVDVYWPMRGFKNGTNADLAKATLEFKPWDSGSCFEFAQR